MRTKPRRYFCHLTAGVLVYSNCIVSKRPLEYSSYKLKSFKILSMVREIKHIKIGNVQIRIHGGGKVFWVSWVVGEQRSRDQSEYDASGKC